MELYPAIITCLLLFVTIQVDSQNMTKSLADSIKRFMKLTSAKTDDDIKYISSKACGKMVKDCLPKEVVTITDDTIIFSRYKEKRQTYMLVANFPAFVRSCAHEYAKLKTKNSKLPADAEEVEKYYQDFVQRLETCIPKVKKVNMSKTGGVDGLTDKSSISGSHKERFDDFGKGKERRVSVGDGSGYAASYKGTGKFNKKHSP